MFNRRITAGPGHKQAPRTQRTHVTLSFPSKETENHWHRLTFLPCPLKLHPWTLLFTMPGGHISFIGNSISNKIKINNSKGLQSIFLLGCNSILHVYHAFIQYSKKINLIFLFTSEGDLKWHNESSSKIKMFIHFNCLLNK